MGKAGWKGGHKAAGEGVGGLLDRSRTPGQGLGVKGEVEHSGVVAGQLARPGRLDGLLGHGLLVVAHDKAGGVKIAQARFLFEENGEEVGLVLGPADEGGGEGPVAAQGVDQGADGPAGDVDALEAGRLAVQVRAIVAGRHLGPGGDGLGQGGEEDQFVRPRRTGGQVHIRGEEARLDVGAIDQGPGQKAHFHFFASPVQAPGPPEGGHQVFEGR